MRLPFPESILHQHSATLGKTGAGKSSALRVSVEHLLDKKKRVVIIDPKGDWWGLKASADGKSAGYPVITFGNFKNDQASDVPINEHSGRHVAELIASGNRPCVIGFRGWMPSQMMNFWVGQEGRGQADGFAPTLFNKNEGELYLFIDEVQNFAAKGKIISPQAGMCVHWTNKMASESRGLGITLHIASQRSQKVHNDTLDCCETLFAMRVTHTAARDSVEEWINSKGDPKFGKEVLGTLAELKRGEAWVWSPENDFGPERVQFPMFQTFDSFAPPQLQKKVSNAGWSEVDLDQVREKLATVIAEQKANDPKELRAQVAQLKKELAAKPKAEPVTTAKIDPERDKKIADRAAKHATVPLLKRLHEFKRYADIAFNQIAQLRSLAAAELPPEPTFEEVMPKLTAPRAEVRTVPFQPKPARVTPAPSNGNGHGDTSLSPGERKILTAVVQFGGVDRDQLGVLTKFKATSRYEYCRKLAQKGLVITGPTRIEPTNAAEQALGEFEPLPTGSALYDYWTRELRGGELAILQFLVSEKSGQPATFEEIEQAANCKSTSRYEFVRKLTARKLVEKTATGMVQAAGALFD